MIRSRGVALAAGRRHAQLAALLDHHDQRVRVEQRQPAVGHQPQQPQLRSGEHATRLVRRSDVPGLRPVRGPRCRPRLLDERCGREPLSPGGQPDRDRQRAPLAVDFDLDRPQPLQRTPRDDLAPRPVGAGEQRRSARASLGRPTWSKRRSSPRSARGEVRRAPARRDRRRSARAISSRSSITTSRQLRGPRWRSARATSSSRRSASAAASEPARSVPPGRIRSAREDRWQPCRVAVESRFGRVSVPGAARHYEPRRRAAANGGGASASTAAGAPPPVARRSVPGRW